MTACLRRCQAARLLDATFVLQVGHLDITAYIVLTLNGTELSLLQVKVSGSMREPSAEAHQPGARRALGGRGIDYHDALYLAHWVPVQQHWRGRNF